MPTVRPPHALKSTVAGVGSARCKHDLAVVEERAFNDTRAMAVTEPPIRRAFSVAVFARCTRGPQAGKVLLIRHKRLGTWLPVGGEIDPGEDPLSAARRELREETGLEGTFTLSADAVDGAPAGLVAYEEHAAGSKGIHQNFCFVADVDVTAGDERPKRQ